MLCVKTPSKMLSLLGKWKLSTFKGDALLFQHPLVGTYWFLRHCTQLTNCFNKCVLLIHELFLIAQ